MRDKGGKDPIGFTARVVITLLALEIITLPLRPVVTETLQNVLYNVLPDTFHISWECTALDEVFLLASAVWWALWPRTNGRTMGDRIKGVIVPIIAGTFVVELYNIIRIAILAYHPDPTLHTVLFRAGGYLVVLITYWAILRRWSKGANVKTHREKA